MLLLMNNKTVYLENFSEKLASNGAKIKGWSKCRERITEIIIMDQTHMAQDICNSEFQTNNLCQKYSLGF